tara:strand:+ start:165 stop:521 length:357 start_codon:yes stop_codon:yes gene_type:complete
VKKVDIGKHGESIAIEYLTDKGLEIIDKNFYTRFGEIDIIAKNKDVYHFIEVKTRLGDTYGKSLEAMTSSKLRHFTRTVEVYAKKYKIINHDLSMDFIGIDIANDGTIEIEWIENISL